MSERDYRDYIDDIINSVKYIREFTDNITFESFKSDIKTQYAVIRCFEVMGEASKRIPDDYKAKYPLIPWKVMAGMRDMIRLRSSPVRSGTIQGPARCVM